MGKALKLSKKSSWTALQATVLAFVAYAVSLAFAAVVGVLVSPTSIGENEQTFLIYATNTLVLLFVALIFLRRKKVSLKSFFNLPEKFTLLLIPVYFIVYVMMSTAVQTLIQLVPGYDAAQAQDVGFATAHGWGLILIFVSLVILPPIGEEVIFRGILYPGLKRSMKKMVAAIVVSLLFGLAHLQWNVGIDTFVLSLVAIVAYEKHSSIWLPIGIHGVKNLVAFLALFVFKI